MGFFYRGKMQGEYGRSRPFLDASCSDIFNLCNLFRDRKAAVPGKEGVSSGLYGVCFAAADIRQLFDLSGVYFFTDAFETGKGGIGKCDPAVFYLTAFKDRGRGKRAGEGGPDQCILADGNYGGRLSVQYDIRIFMLYVGDADSGAFISFI